MKRSHEQLIILNEISTSISTSFEIQKILKEALLLLKQMTKSEGAIIYRTEENTEDLVLADQIGFDIASVPSILRLKRKQSITGDVVTAQKGLYIEDNVVDDERVNPQNRIVLKNYNIQAMAVVPLLAKDKILGALDIFYSSRHEFSERERQVLTQVGNQLGVAVESAQLYGELRSQVDRLTLLNDFSQKLTSTLDIEQIFRITYDHVQQVIPFSTFSIDLYDEPSKMKTPAFSVEGGVYHPVFLTVSGKPVPLDPASIEGKVVMSKDPYYSEDRKTICIPMMSKRMIIGILTMTSVEPMKYGDTHRQLLESVGNLTAIASEKGVLYEETLQKSSEIERRNKELDDFTYVVSHDLKEPLISIEGFSRILQSDYNDIIQPEGREYF
ncbi:MAG TPA: GAF domain-containing protein, partial [Bacteroidota bacterium]|nr:GAF domain-containing protein [Bacteroidota bacterium]